MPAPAPPATRVARLAAWTGGAAFVGALLYYAWFFFVRLGHAVPPDEGHALLPAAAMNLALFGVFAAHHSVMARSGAKRWLAAHLSPALERTAYNWVASVLFAGVCALWWRVPGVVYELDGVWGTALIGVQALGVAFTLRGAAVLDVWELAGIRQAHGDVRPPAFRVVGPFRYVRHPIYLGWILIVFGAPLMTVDRLLWAVVSTAYLLLAIPWEEQSLVETFGDTYRDYQRQVRWRVIPFVY